MALRYASLVWTSHILPELHIPELSDLRRQFFREKLLKWIKLGGVTHSVARYMSSISQLQSAMEDVLRSPIPTVVSLVLSSLLTTKNENRLTKTSSGAATLSSSYGQTKTS